MKMTSKSLDKKDRKKRKVSDEPIILDSLFSMLQDFMLKSWPYKVNMRNLILRDKALMCFLLLSGCRVSEALRLKRKQFFIYDDRIEVLKVETLKKGNTRDKIVFPLYSKLEPFTLIVLEWLETIEEKDYYVFPPCSPNGHLRFNTHLSRYRAHTIIKHNTEMFPHWFRGVCETIYGKLVFKNDVWKLAQFMGLKTIESTLPYVSKTWEADLKNLKNL